MTDFLIVGAMKAGTTSLGFHLYNHPEISIPPHEVHYFDRESNYSKGVQWYEEILKDKGKPNAIISGEKTPTYSYDQKCAKRIFDYNPEIKLIWIFRNPVDRSYSNYLHAYKQGGDHLTFEKAIKNESRRLELNKYKGYLERSKYIDQVRNYQKYFSLQQMYFMTFEELINNPDEELKKLFAFLQVSDSKFSLLDEPRNPTVLPRFQLLLFLATKLFGRKTIPWKVINKICYLNTSPGYPKMSYQTREELNKYFSSYNNELHQLTGLNIDHWN